MRRPCFDTPWLLSPLCVCLMRNAKSVSGNQALRIWILSFRIDSRADWCKNTVVCDESMMFGMMRYAITINFWYRAIKCQLYQSCQGRYYALLLKFSCKRKILNLTIISDKKESHHWKDASVKRYKAINSDGIVPAHVQFVVLVPERYILKALIQLTRNIENHAIARFTPYFAFFFIQQSIL